MRRLFSTVDQLLRGELTSREQLRQGEVRVKIRLLVGAGLLLGAIYGVFMGLYGALRPENASISQLLATSAKVPLLFLATLAVTFPSLYVLSALAGSRLRFLDALRLLLVGIVVDLALLASFGPITGFFTVSTESYPFMIVLNVVFFSLGGLAGLVFMYKALSAVVADEDEVGETWERVPDDGPSREGEKGPEKSPKKSPEKSPEKGPEKSPEKGILPPPPQRPGFSSSFGSRMVFVAWTVIYGAVGAQMGWILRPFVGSPGLPFELFRERQSNFFEAFLEALRQLFAG